MDSPAFITKVLLPQRRADTLRRPRLVDFLHQHIDRRLVLVCAPAGYGKTTLLVDFAHDVAIPVCWYALGPADADIRVFLEYLIAAIRERFPDFGRQTEAVLRGTADLSKELSAVIGTLVSEMHAAIPEYFILALDDFHTVDSSEQVNTALDLLIYHLPENCHIIVSSRAIPRLTLSRLAAHRQVAGLGNSDLRFTAEEVKRLLSENYKVLLPAKTAEALAVESEGWIAGIILTTHTMWQGLLESIIRAKGAGGEVFDYLASEVFAQQPEDVQRFLLGSSVLEQLHPQLCAELLADEDAAAKLLYLEEANLFITQLDGADGWYRYHQLFKAFLESKLRAEQPDWHASLQRRAAALAAARSAWDEAITHYGRGGDYESAANLIIACAGEMIDTGKLPTLARWIDALPAGVIAARPQLLLVRARLCFKSGEPDRGLELLNQAYGHFAAKGDRLNSAQVLALRSFGLTVKGRYNEAVEDCQRALVLAGADDASLAADVHRNLGICHGMQGRFKESIAALGEALRLQRAGGDQYGVATLHQSLGYTCARLGDVPRARFHHEQALAIWRRLGDAGALGQTLNSLGVLQFYDGEYEAALATLTEALAKAREGNYLRIEAAVLADIGDVQRTRRHYGEAIEHYERGLEIARRIEEGYLVGYALNALGDTYARMGEFRRADRLIRQGILQAEERESPYERGMYETSLGMLRCDQGEPAKGLRSMVRACELLRQSGANRELTRALIGRARALHLLGRSREALAQLQSALTLGAEIEYEQFLVRDGKRNEALLAAARDHGIADRRLVAVLQALSAAEDQPSPPAETTALRAVASPRLAPLQALALGQARVLRDGKEITRSGWASDKVRELFFFLLAHPYSLHKDQIVESLWPDLPPGSYNSTFHSTMYRLRRALQGDYIVQREGRYRLSAEMDCYYDVAEFERLLDEADRLPQDSAEVGALYRRALAIYRGPFLNECNAEWSEARGRQLAAKLLSALTRLATWVAARGEYGAAIEICGQVLAEDNFRDEVHYLLLKCYVAVGDAAAGLRHYRRYVMFLRDELGVDPPPKVRAIYEQIMKGERRTTGPRPVTR